MLNDTAKNCDRFTLTEINVLREHRLLDDSGELVEVYLERPEEKPLGFGPKMELDAIRKLIAADGTPDQRWLNWIFFQAGGGQRAKDAADRAMEQTKERFIDERVNGFENPETKEKFPPVPKQEAEARWMAVLPRWQEILISADQDVVDHLGVFGYHRAWPGKDKVYSRVVKAISQSLKSQDKLEQMNAERVASGAEEVNVSPCVLATLDDLEKVNRKVERYFASKEARDDIQVEHIFEDDYVRVLCPLTYAASVRYGFDNWPFSNRVTFDEVLDTEHSFRDAWKSTVSRSVLVFWYWKVPMPSWISRRDSKFYRYELVNLALELPRSAMTFDADSPDLVFHDEENVANMNLRQVQTMIVNESQRLPDIQDEEMPVKRGPNAYGTEAEAMGRLNALDRAFGAVMNWAEKFDVQRIKVDALGADKDEAAT